MSNNKTEASICWMRKEVTVNTPGHSHAHLGVGLWEEGFSSGPTVLSRICSFGDRAQG